MNSEWQIRDPNRSDEEKVLLNWQSRVECLEEWVCLLLMKNQLLREALLAERARGNIGNLSIALTRTSQFEKVNDPAHPSDICECRPRL
jgi:hypothetical protein